MFLSGLALGAGLLTLLTPDRLVRLCTMPAMRCQMVTKPGAMVLGVLTLLAALVAFLPGIKGERR